MSHQERIASFTVNNFIVRVNCALVGLVVSQCRMYFTLYAGS